jgi:MiaB/RimO family radical SAM methylthiotransferase
LTGQDTGCYGKDIGVNLVDLLSAACEIDGDFWIRVGMMTPNSAISMLPELVKVFKNDRIFKFAHLPVQSGDNEILKQMNRHYSVEDFWRVVKAFRKSVPNITLSTDVICGFPGESAEAFEGTLRLIRQVRPDVVNVSKFFPRPKTSAAEMTPKVDSFEVMARSRRLTDFVKKSSFEKNSSWIGWNGRILLDEVGKKPDSLIGRNFAYKPIVVKNVERSLLGNLLNVRVTKAFQTYLEAEIIS